MEDDPNLPCKWNDYCVNRDCSIRNILQLAIQVSGSILSYIFPTNQQIKWKRTPIYLVNGRRSPFIFEMEDDLNLFCKWKTTSIIL
jgi:hypothetical protein